MSNASLQEFLWFMCERQDVYKRRHVLNEEPPWTDNPELQSYHFCNIYRELDKGTQYYLENIATQDDERDILFNTVFYRVLNDPKSYEAAGGFTAVEEWDVDKVCDELEEYSETHQVFSPAYRVTAHRFADSDSKVENIMHGIVELFRADIDTYLDDLQDSDSYEECHSILMRAQALGGFLAYEVLTDLNYVLLPYSENDFVHVGPGAESGLERAFGSKSDRDRSDVELLEWLMENQEDLFDRYDLDFYYWNGEREKRLTLRDFEHASCEYNKFRRAKQKDNPNLRKFQPMSGEQLYMDEFR